MGSKNDKNDAVAIVEAGSRPSMRYVPEKYIEQQDIQCLHQVRQRLAD
ncbi:IS110 family transposase [Salmonella enterica]|uniref:IS110 family transposase n=2 Tax=Salmonella enterica TaxID=28901 RepID=A0A619QRD3_SALER|nr:IS110 family transposase [Salmonella enterica subsp. houtenae]EAA8307084.1 IS110 family transposase [Salmonella enterica]EAW1967687.1 IS110 family transposase [Salmonella enterica subsp. enterica]ECA8471319.1 IS110 family transposase [Salmonella enterica subsp. enterica serovar Saintpaul]ECB4836155.1 IS110 family transposase [Salmonella enterica subsp. enterica serovar Bareilly]EDW0018425.1 IS110 family transposase [Salmonella enterica subsp. enterica serovar Aba]EDX2043816.1 IS110 family 